MSSRHLPHQRGERFFRVLRRKGLFRHFQRSPVPEMLRGRHLGKPVPVDITQALLDAARAEPAAVLAQLDSQADGLSKAQAAAIRRRVGANEVAREPPVSWWVHLWHCYRNPFNLLLTVLIAVSGLTHDRQAALVIGAMVALSTLLRFGEETRSHRAAEALRSRVSNTTTVLRRGNGATPETELPIIQLVPGDVVRLSAGDMIPADLRVLTAKDLFVNQSAMTGESLPVEKFATAASATLSTPLEALSLCFMGTNVVSGSATAVVVGTGQRTVFGTLVMHATEAATTPTAFQTGVNRVSGLLIRFMLVMVPLVFVINGFTKGDWIQALLFALSIAVGLTPEMLPMIVTSTLARGAVLLSRRKVIVKRLDAIQNFGAMDVLCTDKTGTLTQDRIALKRHMDAFGEESAQVLEYAYLNSHYQTGLRNLLDTAVLEHAELHMRLGVNENYTKLDEIPFDFERRRMSVVVNERDQHHLLICKGAVEEVLAVCTHVRRGEATEPLTDALRQRLAEVTENLNREGLRVVSVAVRELPLAAAAYSVASEQNLALVGYIAFLDPPKESTAPALKALAGRGIQVKVLTGDNEFVTAKICHDVGLAVTGVVRGAEVQLMGDVDLARAVETANVFAKLSPLHKERIIRCLRANGHVTGFMGDGINDAAALHAADVGISVDTAVDIAKEAADIVLLEKSLAVLEQGVIEGRKTFVNMLKYIKMTASSNFGNVLSVLVASAFLPFLPMLPVHLLVQNLLYDLSQTGIPFDNVDDSALRTPQHWAPEEMGRFMLHFGPVSSLFDLLTFALMWTVFQANSVAMQSLFQSGWFVEGLLSQTLIVHMIRTRGLPFVQSWASPQLLIMSVLVVAVGLALPASPLAPALRLQALPVAYFAWLAGLLLAYAAVVHVMKRYYIARYDWQ
jgi:P-type Mg2+ transporter